jgi:CheY-like chemotaxis protein
MYKIIVVEDNPQDAKLTLKALAKAGHSEHVTVFTSGQEALDCFAQGGCDAESSSRSTPVLVLLDLHLPDISGLDVLRGIRAGTFAKWVPVVVFTTDANSEAAQDCYEAGANSYLVKSVDFHDFVATVSHAVDYWVGLNVVPQ